MAAHSDRDPGSKSQQRLVELEYRDPGSKSQQRLVELESISNEVERNGHGAAVAVSSSKYDIIGTAGRLKTLECSISISRTHPIDRRRYAGSPGRRSHAGAAFCEAE